jgi:hypothetical protein
MIGGIFSVSVSYTGICWQRVNTVGPPAANVLTAIHFLNKD